MNDQSFKKTGCKVYTFAACLLLLMFSCRKNEEGFIATTVLYSELELPAGLTPLKGHYFRFETENSIVKLVEELGYDLDEVKLQGNSALLLADQNQSWGFLQSAQILENAGQDSQIFFASDGNVVSNTSRAILFPFDVVLNEYFGQKQNNGFVLKLTTFQTNISSFRVRIELHVNILLENS